MQPAKPQELATDDLFFSLHMFALEFQEIAERGRTGDAEKMRRAALDARKLALELEPLLVEMETQTAQFPALDALMGEDRP